MFTCSISMTNNEKRVLINTLNTFHSFSIITIIIIKGSRPILPRREQLIIITIVSIYTWELAAVLGMRTLNVLHFTIHNISAWYHYDHKMIFALLVFYLFGVHCFQHAQLIETFRRDRSLIHHFLLQEKYRKKKFI